MTTVSEHRSAALAYLLLPLPVVVAEAVCWAYLATGNGGQDVSGMAPLIQAVSPLVPWHADGGLSVVGSLGYLAYLVGTALLLIRGLAGRSDHVRRHTRRALTIGLFMVPAALQLPYVLGVTVALPVNGFSVVRGLEVVGGNPAGTLARFVSGIAFSGIVLPLPLGPIWRESMVNARQGLPPAELLRKHRVGMAIGAALAGFVFVMSFVETI